jgi:hypothetical protein
MSCEDDVFYTEIPPKRETSTRRDQILKGDEVEITEDDWNYCLLPEERANWHSMIGGHTGCIYTYYLRKDVYDDYMERCHKT